MKRFILFILVLLIIPASVFAQARLTGGDIQGTVLDNTGGVMPGVTVTATHVATNQSRSVTTDEAGKYYLPALSAGVYTVHAELAGFQPQTKSDVRLQLGQRLD